MIRKIIDGLKEFWGLMDWNLNKYIIAMVIVLSVIIVYGAIGIQVLWLMALGCVSFIQNLFFTLVSRSRNGSDFSFHRKCAWGSNTVWFCCQVLIVKNIWSAINTGNWIYAILACIVYGLCTTEGSVLMMKKLVKSESGKKRVGAAGIEQVEERVKVLENIIQVGKKYSLDLPTKKEAYKND